MDVGPPGPTAAQPEPQSGSSPDPPTDQPTGRSAGPGDRVPEQMPRWLPRAIALVFVGVIALAAGSYLLTRLHDLLLTLVVALFLSFALEPAVDSLARRGWRRGPATALVLVVLLGTVVIFLGLIGKLVVDQVSQFIDQAPSKSQNIEHWINAHFGTHLSNKQIQKEFNDPNGADPQLRHQAGRQRARLQPQCARGGVPLLHHPAVHLLPGGRRTPLPSR